MFSPKSPKTSGTRVESASTRGAGEQICMVECGCGPDCTRGLHTAACGRGRCAPDFQGICIDVENQGFDNLAYEYGSQSDLHLPPTSASRVTLHLRGLCTEHQARAIESRTSTLKGVLGISLSLPRKLAKVDYDTSAITTKELALELQSLGHSVESAVQIRVDGMHCHSCVQSIEGHVAELPGVTYIQVSLQDKAALIVFQPLLVTQQELRDEIEDMGFDATLLTEDPSAEDISCWQRDISTLSTETVTVWIGGMTCSSCVQSIEGRISQMSGTLSINVSLEDGKGTITFDPCLTAPEQLRAAVEDMGFDASLQEPVETIQSQGKLRPVTSGPSRLPDSQTHNKAGVSNGTGSQRNNQPRSPDVKVQKCFICVTGMTCTSCVSNIEKNLLKHKGILSVLVSLMAGKAEVKYDSDATDANAVTQLIEDLGFGAKLMEDNAVSHGKLDLSITGMTCASCVHNIESELTTTKGILGASVALATKKSTDPV